MATEKMRGRIQTMNYYSYLVITNARNTANVRRGRHPVMTPSYDLPTVQRRMPR